MTDRTQATDQDNQLSIPQQGDHNVRQDPLNKATNLKKTLKKTNPAAICDKVTQRTTNARNRLRTVSSRNYRGGGGRWGGGMRVKSILLVVK